MPSIITLKLEVYNSLRVLTNLLQTMPNLRHLTVETDDIDMNGHQWEDIIVNHLLKLQVFQLEMKFRLRNNEDKEQRMDQLLKSFQTRFWLEEHQWFVRCDWDQHPFGSKIYLYTLPYTSNYYCIHDLTIKAKSSSPDNDIYPSYNQVHILSYEFTPSENRILPQFTFSNIHDLILYLPIDDNFWSIVPQFDHLKSLEMKPYKKNQHNLDSQFQVQTILDRAPRLYSLDFGKFGEWTPTSMGMPPFEYSNKSVRRLNLQDVDRVYNSQQCDTLSRSSLGIQCEVLSITVENRTTIIDLLNTMPNLRALNVLSRDDPWTNENGDSSSSKNDELVEWLQHRLPSTYKIIRNSNEIWKWRSSKSFWSVLLWIS
jgi:hypothetical protein